MASSPSQRRTRPLRALAARALVLAVAGLALVAEPSAAQAVVWPSVPEAVERGLASPDPSVRRSSAAELAKLPRSLAEPLALRALADEDTEVRILVARVAATHALEGAADRVLGWLSDPDPRVRFAACELIRAAPSERAVTALGRVLSDPAVVVRASAARAIGGGGAPELSSLLLGHLDDTAPEVRFEVVRALARLGDRRAALPLLGRVQDSAVEVRRQVVRALGELGDPRATSALVLALEDPALEVRVDAATSLGQLGSDEATLALASLLGGREPTEAARGAPPSTEGREALRRAALGALARIGSARALGFVIDALEGDRPDARRTPARDALVSVGAPAVAPLLDFLGRAPAGRAASSAVQALARIGDARAAPKIVAVLRAGLVPPLEALEAISVLRDPSALPAALELIDSPSPEIRRAAIAAASALLEPARADGRAVEPVSDALAEPELALGERIALVELLGRTGSPRASGVLVGLLSSRSAPLRLAALRALSELSQSSSLVDAALLHALEDERGDVRAEAALALGRVGDPKLASSVLDRLERAAEVDRGALGVALSGLLARSRDDALAARVAAALLRTSLLSRDALVEGLGRMPTARALAELERLGSGDLDDRRKLAEALAGHGPAAERALARLARDVDAGVRANAAWSLGEAGSASAAALLEPLLLDADVAVAANAASALGRLASRLGKSELALPVCARFADARSSVRESAVVAAALAGLSNPACSREKVVGLLARDREGAVRAAAARWLHAVAPEAERRAPLARCASEDPTFEVARLCRSAPRAAETSHAVTVYVVPDGSATPTARASYALRLPDGRTRHGVADRRAVVFERAVPSGELELGVPAALVEAGTR